MSTALELQFSYALEPDAGEDARTLHRKVSRFHFSTRPCDRVDRKVLEKLILGRMAARTRKDTSNLPN